MDERIVEMLKSGNKPDKLRALSEAAGSLEKGVIKEVAECYFSEDEEIRERAFGALRQTAQKFADSLQTFLNLFLGIAPSFGMKRSLRSHILLSREKQEVLPMLRRGRLKEF